MRSQAVTLKEFYSKILEATLSQLAIYFVAFDVKKQWCSNEKQQDWKGFHFWSLSSEGQSYKLRMWILVHDFRGWQTSRRHKGRILVDKKGEFSWTLLVNSCGHFLVNSQGHFRWIFLDIFLIVMIRVTLSSSNNITYP